MTLLNNCGGEFRNVVKVKGLECTLHYILQASSILTQNGLLTKHWLSDGFMSPTRGKALQGGGTTIACHETRAQEVFLGHFENRGKS